MNAYIPPTDPTRTRAPCPGLNALANHGYISRSGTSIPFLHLLHTILTVYNLSLPLALLLTIPGYILYGSFSWSFSFSSFPVTWTLDLASTSKFGLLRVAHTASFIHPNVPSHAPSPFMFRDFLSCAAKEDGYVGRGDLAKVRVKREERCVLTALHRQIALGESGLLYELLREEDGEGREGIRVDRLRTFLVEERLPEGIGRRRVGVLGARRVGDEVGRIMSVDEAGGGVV